MPSSATTRRVIIMGAAGRDFHNFNTALHDDPAREVIAFTAAQIPGIAGRSYPTSLAGQRYPHGIPILPEDDLAAQIRDHNIDEVIFAYSDVEHALVMHKASIVLAAGADSLAVVTDIITHANPEGRVREWLEVVSTSDA